MMYLDSQTAEILGWLFITLYITLPDIIVALKSPRKINITSFIYSRYFGFLIGSILLFDSGNYGIYAFSFLIFLFLRGIATSLTILLNIPILYFILMLFSELFLLFIIILFGIFFKTEIWFITATLYVLFILLEFIHIFIIDRNVSKNDAKESMSKFLPGLIIPFTSILYIFNIGILESATLYAFYSTLITGFFALLSIIAMFGVFILRQNEIDRKNLSGLFKGLITLYIIAILFLTLGLITLPKNSEDKISVDLTYSTLIPNSSLNERQLSNTEQIFGKIMFAASFGFLVSSLGYLYLMVSEMLKKEQSTALVHEAPELNYKNM